MTLDLGRPLPVDLAAPSPATELTAVAAASTPWGGGAERGVVPGDPR